MRVGLANGAQHVEPPDVRHAQVHHHEIRAPGLQLNDRLAPARARHHVEACAPRETAHHVKDALFVVHDDQQRPLPCHTHSFATARTAARSALS